MTFTPDVGRGSPEGLSTDLYVLGPEVGSRRLCLGRERFLGVPWVHVHRRALSETKCGFK